MNNLYQTITIPLTKAYITEFEELDSNICQLIQEAEKQCRWVHMGSVQWSPQFKKSSIILEYWLQYRSYHTCLHPNIRLLITLQRQACIIYSPSLSVDEIDGKIILAYKHRHNCKKNAASLSLEYRTQLTNTKKEAGECFTVVYICSLNNTEVSRRLFQDIRHMEGKSGAGAISQIRISNSDNTSIDTTDPLKMNTALLTNNGKLYHQTKGGSKLLTLKI